MSGFGATHPATQSRLLAPSAPPTHSQGGATRALARACRLQVLLLAALQHTCSELHASPDEVARIASGTLQTVLGSFASHPDQPRLHGEQPALDYGDEL